MQRTTFALEDISLIVRALHQDVSALDERLRRLEAALRDLREQQREMVGETVDLRMVPAARD